MKPEQWQLEPSVYPWQTSIEPRFSDMDVLGHLNNVAIGRLFEEARVRLQFHQIGPDMLTPERLKEARMVVAQLNTSYLREADYPTTLTCGLGLAKLGRSSYVMWSTLWQNKQAIAFQECVMVVTSEAGPITLPDALRQRLQAHRVQRAQDADV